MSSISHNIKKKAQFLKRNRWSYDCAEKHHTMPIATKNKKAHLQIKARHPIINEKDLSNSS